MLNFHSPSKQIHWHHVLTHCSFCKDFTAFLDIRPVTKEGRKQRDLDWVQPKHADQQFARGSAIKKIPLLAFYALGRSVAGVVAARWNRQTKQLFAISSPLNLQSRCQLRTQPTQEGRCSLFIPLKTCAWACEYVYTCVFIVTQRAVRGLCRFQASLGQHKHREASETGTQSVK